MNIWKGRISAISFQILCNFPDIFANPVSGSDVKLGCDAITDYAKAACNSLPPAASHFSCHRHHHRILCQHCHHRQHIGLGHHLHHHHDHHCCCLKWENHITDMISATSNFIVSIISITNALITIIISIITMTIAISKWEAAACHLDSKRDPVGFLGATDSVWGSQWLKWSFWLL